MRRRGQRGQRGATALELGLVAPMVFLVIFGLIQYGYLFWALTTASASAREAARKMIVGRDWVTCAQSWAITHAQGPAVGAHPVVATYRYTDTNGNTVAGPKVGQLVEVTISFHSLNLGIPIIPVPDGGVVTQKATMEVQNVPATTLPCTEPGNP